jgi:hypothetical protein
VIDSLAIIVNEIPITTYDIEQTIKVTKNKEMAVYVLINKALLKDEIKKRGIYIDEFDIDKELEKLAKRNGMSLLNLKTYLLEKGQLEELKQQLKEKLEKDKILDTLNIKVTPEELKEFYTKNIKYFNVPSFIKVTQYSSRTKQTLEELMQNPMLNSDDLEVKSIKFDLEQTNQKLYRFLKLVKENSFSKIINIQNKFVSFYIEKKGELKNIPFEKVRGEIYQILIEKKANEELENFIAKLKAKADIKFLNINY